MGVRRPRGPGSSPIRRRLRAGRPAPPSRPPSGPVSEWSSRLPCHVDQRRTLTGTLLDRPLAAPRAIYESRVLLEEHHRHVAGGPVAVLGDDQVRLAWVGVLVVLRGAVDEGDDVGVLLDRVVDDYVLGHEVVEALNGEVVNGLLSAGLDRLDPVPVDVALGE